MMNIYSKLKKIVYATCSLLVGLQLLQDNQAAAQSMVTYAGGTGRERFNDVLRLSDNTVLVAGQAENLSWIPANVPKVTLGLSANPSSVNTAVSGINSFAFGKVGFILHLNANMSKILRVVQLPANTVSDVTKIRTNSLPGQPTGNIYISGGRENGDPNTKDGYFIGKLNNNFVKGVPNQLVWTYDVSTRGIESEFKTTQPWDVGADGTIVCATGKEYANDWVSLEVIDGNGIPKKMSHWFDHKYILNDSIYPSLTGTTYGGFNSTDADLETLPKKVWVSEINDSVSIGGYSSYLSLKVSGTNTKTLRSTNYTQFETALSDENGNLGRKGAYPADIYFSCPDETVYFGSTDPKVSCPGNRGYTTGAWTQRVGDIAIDKKTGLIYVSITWDVRRMNLQGSLKKTAVVAFTPTGAISWWARLSREADDTGVTSAQDQIADILGIDYKNEQLVVLARARRRGLFTNLWKGNEITSNPAANGFQNDFTGFNTDFDVSWLGKLRLDNGQLRHVTYIGDLADTARLGTPSADPLMDGWPNLNVGNPSLGNTSVNKLVVFSNGAVGVAGVGKRTITTANAFQKMMKPDRAAPFDSLATVNSFVRVYSPTLTNITYSSLLTGQWDPTTGKGGDNTVITALASNDSSLLVAGYHRTIASNGTRLAGDTVPTINIPEWGTRIPLSESALFAKLDFNCTPPVQPARIIKPLFHCQDTLQAYKLAQGSAPADKRTWIMSNINWKMTQVTPDSVMIRSSAIGGGGLRVYDSNTCGVSTSSALAFDNATTPPTKPVFATPNAVVQCVGTSKTYRLKAQTGVTNFAWALPGTNWTGSSQNDTIAVTPTTVLGGTLAVRAINGCGMSPEATLVLPKADTLPIKPVFASIVPSVCVGTNKTFRLAAQKDAKSFIWSVPTNWSGTSTIDSIAIKPLASVGGVLYVRAQNNCGMSDTALYLLPVADSLPVKPTITQQLGSIFETNAQSGIQWFRNGLPLDSATNNTLNYNQGGELYVTVTNQCGTSRSESITTVGIHNQLYGYTIETYPNPVYETLQLNIRSNQQAVLQVTIKDILGKTLQQFEINKEAIEVTESVAVGKLTKGIYFVEIANGKSKTVKKVTKL